jgi:hypothetical protein
MKRAWVREEEKLIHGHAEWQPESGKCALSGGIPVKKRPMLISCRLVLTLLAGTAAAQFSTMQAQTAPLSVSLSPSVTSPAPVGTMVTWTAAVSGASSTNLWYRFRVRTAATPLRTCRAQPGTPAPQGCAAPDFTVIRDFGPVSTLDWTASDREGDYELEVSARDDGSGAVAVATAAFGFTPRVTGTAPAIARTANPLVFLYSAPACPEGSSMSVQFQTPEGFVQNTNSKPCDGRTTMNFYLAGMRTQTRYSIQHAVDDGSQTVNGPLLTQTTPAASAAYGPVTVMVPPAGTPPNPVILLGRFGSPVATDQMGNLLWYSQQDISMI